MFRLPELCLPGPPLGVGPPKGGGSHGNLNIVQVQVQVQAPTRQLYFYQLVLR